MRSLYLSALCAMIACAPPAVTHEAAQDSLRRDETPRWRTVHGRAMRRLSEAEARQAGVANPSWIVRDSAALTALAQGASNVVLLVPSGDAAGVLIPLDRVAAETAPADFVVRDGRGPQVVARTFRPTFHHYLSPAELLPRGADVGVLRALVEAGAPGSALMRGARGGAAPGRVRMEVGSPGAFGLTNGERPIIVSVATLTDDAARAHDDCAGGWGGCGAYCANADAQASCDPDSSNPAHPCCEPYDDGGGAIHHQCNDGDDDDGDGLVDASDPDCQHSELCSGAAGAPLHLHAYEAGATVGLFGDIVLCTSNDDRWPAALWDRAAALQRTFRTSPGGPLTGNPSYDSWTSFPNQNKPMRIGVIGCWVMDTVVEAKACRDDGGAACGAFAPGGLHAYPYEGVGGSVLAYAARVRDDVAHGAEHAGLGVALNAAHVVVSVSGLEQTGVVGRAEEEHLFGSMALDVPGSIAISAHEIGHTLGLTHCHKQVLDEYPDGSRLWSLMASRDSGAVCLGDVLDTDEIDDRFGPNEGGQLYTTLMSYDDDQSWHPFLHPPSFGNH